MDERFILTAIVILYSSTTFISAKVLICENDLTTIIKSADDSNINEEYSNFDKINDTHIRVCECEFKTCLTKCCAGRQFMVNDHCQDSTTGMADVFSFVLQSSNISNFRVKYGDGCPARHFTRFYPDDYTNVNYYLRLNGSISIFFDTDVRLVQDFCMENAFRTEVNSSSLLICIRKDLSDFYQFPVGMTMSLPFLISTLIVYSFRELRNIHGKNLSAHVGSLLVAYLSVILVETVNLPESFCVILGFVRQFSFLSSFFWLNVMCFDLWWSLSTEYKTYSKEKERKKYFMYSVCGWGCPAAIVLVTVIMEFTPESLIRPDIGFPNCFLRDGKPFYAYFYGPVIFIFCMDFTFFVLSALRFITAGKKMKLLTVQDKVNIQSTKKRYFHLLKIFIMMAINWIIDPFSWIFKSSFWTWFFIHLSIVLQAISIFIMFVWNNEVKNIIVLKLCGNPYNEFASISLLHTISQQNGMQSKNNETTPVTTSC